MKHTQGKVKKDGDLNVVLVKEGYSLTGCSAMPHEERKANADRAHDIWNAANGMTDEEAVRYLEHGAEMENQIGVLLDNLTYVRDAYAVAVNKGRIPYSEAAFILDLTIEILKKRRIDRGDQS